MRRITKNEYSNYLKIPKYKNRLIRVKYGFYFVE